MRLLSLDYDPVYDDATRGAFWGDLSVFDYDAVIWDPEASLRSYTEYTDDYRGLPSLSPDTSVQIGADVRRRRKEFVDFLSAGRSLVVIVRPPQKCYVDTGERTHSGTGRNRVTTTHVTDFDLLSALPISTVSFEKAEGSRIEVIGDGPVPRLLRKYQSFLGYSAVMRDAPGSVSAKVTGTERIVASVAKMKGDGYLVMLPALDFGESSRIQATTRRNGRLRRLSFKLNLWQRCFNCRVTHLRRDRRGRRDMQPKPSKKIGMMLSRTSKKLRRLVRASRSFRRSAMR